jgi:hypothetical protein
VGVVYIHVISTTQEAEVRGLRANAVKTKRTGGMVHLKCKTPVPQKIFLKNRKEKKQE